MSQETELKLSLPEHQVEILKQHDFWKQHAQSMGTVHLGNTYFDTPEMHLNQARVALRIRNKNGQFLQTLKTKGESINGLTKRGEWEWALTENTLDHDGLKDIWPDALKDVDSQSVIPLFATDFDRTLWQIEWQEPYARIEAALDLGKVKTSHAESQICELELELLEGAEEALKIIANLLSQQIDLEPSDKSKAERGFELLTQN